MKNTVRLSEAAHIQQPGPLLVQVRLDPGLFNLEVGCGNQGESSNKTGRDGFFLKKNRTLNKIIGYELYFQASLRKPNYILEYINTLLTGGENYTYEKERTCNMGIQNQFPDNKNTLTWNRLPRCSCDTSKGKK